MEDSSYGEWLVKSRKAVGLTQKQLAAAADIAPSYVSALETGARARIQVDKCDRLSVALGKPILEGRAAAGYLPGREGKGGFAAIVHDTEGWSDENRREYFARMEKIYNAYREKESKRKRTGASPNARATKANHKKA